MVRRRRGREVDHGAHRRARQSRLRLRRRSSRSVHRNADEPHDRRDLHDQGRPARLCRAHRHHRQCAHARQGHPARVPPGRGRRLQHLEAAPLGAAHQESRLLQEGQHHQRARQRAGQDRHQRRGEEKSTGEFSVGVGFSTTDGPLADIGIHERNLLGRGQDLRLDTIVALRDAAGRSQLHRALFPRPQSGGGLRHLRRSTATTRPSPGSASSRSAARLRAGYQITEELRQTLTYTLRQDRIYNIQRRRLALHPASRPALRNTSAVGQSLLYDKRDSRHGPDRRAITTQLGTDFAGLGGDVRLSSASASPAAITIRSRRTTCCQRHGRGRPHLRASVRPCGIEDRFFVGGDNLRGFQTGGIGPRDVDHARRARRQDLLCRLGLA